MERYYTQMYTQKGMNANATMGAATGNNMNANATMGAATGNNMNANATMGAATGNNMNVNATMGAATGNKMNTNATMGATKINGMVSGAAIGPFEGCQGIPIAMAYVPRQSWQNIYKSEVALMRGTIFPELDLPFLGKEAGMNGR